MLPSSSPMLGMGGRCNSISLGMNNNVAQKHAHRARLSLFGDTVFPHILQIKDLLYFTKKKPIVSIPGGVLLLFCKCRGLSNRDPI